jgi:hypothetical protein
MQESLIDATFLFQLCVRNSVDKQLSQVGKMSSAQVLEMEEAIWRNVLDRCRKDFGDKEKGLILLHYGGDNAKAIGYWEGVVYFARLYVLSRTADYLEDPKHPQ